MAACDKSECKSPNDEYSLFVRAKRNSGLLHLLRMKVSFPGEIEEYIKMDNPLITWSLVLNCFVGHCSERISKGD